MNAAATAAIALVAGGEAGSALRLGALMLCMQASIGAVNDVADVPLDRIAKPSKPIPAGDVALPAARGWAVVAGLLCLVLALPSGVATAVVSALGLALGYLYDLRLSRTRLSWLPLALALPLVPLIGWLGARGSIPAELWILLPIAMLAGGALLGANGLVDVEGDALAGRLTIPVWLGRRGSWLAHAAGLAAAVALALLFMPLPAARDPDTALRMALRLAWMAGIPLGVVAIAAGAAILSAPRPGIRERGWELEALGTAVLGLGWLAGVALATGGGAAP